MAVLVLALNGLLPNCADWLMLRKQVCFQGILTGWSHSRLLEIKSPDFLAGEATSSTGEGKRINGEITIKKEGDDKYVWKSTRQISGGESMPNVEIVFTRVRK